MSEPSKGVPVSHLRLFLHDINNEMFAVSGNLQLHELQKGRPEGEKTLHGMRSGSDELQILLAELADYASWCGDGVTVNLSFTDLCQVAAAGVERAAASLRRFNKQARLATPGAPVRVSADAQLVARAVHALVRVSLWRGACGDVVPVTVSQEDGLGVVSAEDKGSAFPQEVVPRLFTAEGILDSKSRGIAPGRPTALLFARIACESMGGRCWATSAAASTKVSIGFPLAK